MLLSPFPPSLPSGNPDVKGMDCLSGYCYLNICTERSKACPSGCSGHGACAWYASAASTTPLPSPCTEFSDMCYAACTCSSGWYGAACDLSASDFLESRRLIETLCAQANAASRQADVTLGSLLQQASAVSTLLADPTLLSPASLGNCTQMLVTSVSDNPTAVANSATARTAVLSALRNSLRIALPPLLVLAVHGATMALVVASQDTLGINETPLELVLGSTRVKTLVLDTQAASKASIAAPLSWYEEGNGKKSATLSSLTHTGGVSTSALGVSLVQFTDNPAGLNMTTSSMPVTVQLSAYLSVSTAGSIRSSSSSRRLAVVPEAAPGLKLVPVEDVLLDHARMSPRSGHRFRRLSTSLASAYSFVVKLPNNAPVSYRQANTTVVTRTCQTAGQVISLPAGCGRPTSNAYTCLAAGSLRFTCAAQTLEPQCILMGADGSFAPDATSCTRVSYTATSTTCACNLAPAEAAAAVGSRRSLSSTVSTGSSVTVASTALQSSSAYSESFSGLPTAAPTPASSVVVATLSFTFAGLNVADLTVSAIVGIRNATAHLCKPPLDLASVLATVSAASTRRSASSVEEHSRSLSGTATGVKVVVSVVATAASPNTNAFAQLSAATPSTLLAALQTQPALSGFNAAQLQPSSLVVSNAAPTAAPTKGPPAASGSTASPGFGLGATVGLAAGAAGLICLAALAHYWRTHAHAKAKAHAHVEGPGPSDVAFGALETHPIGEAPTIYIHAFHTFRRSP